MRQILLALLLTLTQRLDSQNFTPDWASLDSRPTPAWWLDAKFGIFIHWGVYAVPGWCSKGNYAEWYQNGLMNGDTARQAFHRAKFGADFSYYQFADQFKAELYDPNEWAQLFEKSGAKYVVLTSKHHDGYCLWPSAEANKTWGFQWNSSDRGPRRDLLGDLFKALRKTSVKPGMYYSLYEWFNPLWKANKQRYANEHATPQMRELISKYKPYVFWTDGDWDAQPEVWKSQELLSWAFNESPVRDSLVVNDRWGAGVRFHHAGIYTPEYQPDVDFENHAWEESRGMGMSYGYNRGEDSWDYNSTQTLIYQLLDKVSRGGNFLLDIGPDEHGKIPPIMQERLLEMGDWLRLNGEAIYGTRRWRTPIQWSPGRRCKPEGKGGDIFLLETVAPPSPECSVREVFFSYNSSSNSLFATFPRWPDDGRLVLRDMNLPAGTVVSFLENGDKLVWENSGSDVAVRLPVFNPNKIKSSHAWSLKIKDFGKFSPHVEILVKYNFETGMPSATMSSPLAESKIHFTVDGSEPTENSPIFSGETAVPAGAKIRARAFAAGILPSAVSELATVEVPHLQAVKMKGQPKLGLFMEMVSPQKWDKAEWVEKVATGVGAVVPDFTMGPKCATSKCAQIFWGYVKVDDTGTYRFSTDSDDGSLLYLDNQLIVSNDGLHGMERREGLATLDKGFHQIKVVYFNVGGDAGLKVSAARVSKETDAPIPAGLLFH